MKYNPENPEEADICYACPVFLSNEKTILIQGKVVKISSGWPISNIYTIRYAFGVDHIFHIRTQELPSNYKELYPNIEAGQYYEVECWADNPQRSIIRLDKPWKRL